MAYCKQYCANLCSSFKSWTTPCNLVVVGFNILKIKFVYPSMILTENCHVLLKPGMEFFCNSPQFYNVQVLARIQGSHCCFRWKLVTKLFGSTHIQQIGIENRLKALLHCEMFCLTCLLPATAVATCKLFYETRPATMSPEYCETSCTKHFTV